MAPAREKIEVRNCLVCEAPILECHFGIDECRACAVFYKRTRVLNRNLIVCKQGDGKCKTTERSTSCRKCRFEKFEWILANGGEQLGEFDDSDECNQHPSSSIIDHRCFSFSPIPLSDTPSLDTIKRGYSLLCLIRKSGEFSTHPRAVDQSIQVFIQVLKGIDSRKRRHASDQADLKPHDSPFVQETYTSLVTNARVFVAAFSDFAEMTFPDFKRLSNKHKRTIVGCSLKLVKMLESTYRAARHFPYCDTAMPSYLTTLTVESVEKLFEDCPHPINKAEVVEEMRRNLSRSIKLTKGYFLNLQISDDEFLALLGLAFWNEDIIHADGSLTEIVERNRSSIMREWRLVYSKNGIEDYASRIGELFCFLVSIENAVSLSHEDLRVYQLLKMFENVCFVR